MPTAHTPRRRTGKNTDWPQLSSLKLRLSLLRVMMLNFTRLNGPLSSRMLASTTICPPCKSKEKCASSCRTATTTYSLISGAHPSPPDVTWWPGFARAAIPTSRSVRQARTCKRTARTTISCWRSTALITTRSRLSLDTWEDFSSNENRSLHKYLDENIMLNDTFFEMRGESFNVKIESVKRESILQSRTLHI